MKSFLKEQSTNSNKREQFILLFDVVEKTHSARTVVRHCMAKEGLNAFCLSLSGL